MVAPQVNLLHNRILGARECVTRQGDFTDVTKDLEDFLGCAGGPNPVPHLKDLKSGEPFLAVLGETQ